MSAMVDIGQLGCTLYMLGFSLYQSLYQRLLQLGCTHSFCNSANSKNVKEQIILMRCKLTYLRQARRLPELTKSHLLNLNYKDLVRYNRSFQVFKTLRGSQMYFEESKKHVMAMLRQLGCPSLFLTLSSAECALCFFV